MYLVGTVLIVASMALALQAIVSYVLVLRGHRAALLYGRGAVYGSAFTVTLSWLLLVAAFLMRRFDIEYVYQYSSNDLGTLFTIAATWAGQPGSFAVWILFAALVAVPVAQRARHFEPYIMPVLMFVQVGFLLFLLILNPFRPMLDPMTGAPITPADGSGLNPLLHNFWMIIHPPVLFLGFTLAAVPFAYALGALMRYDYDTWIIRALPWTLAAWSTLGFSMLLGGYWAYETLGWGGYWAWDPVENASLVPWLTMTALLHGMVLQRSQGGLRRTNIILGLATFILIIYSTFLTRSGVLTDFSVHSFVAEGIHNIMLIFLGIIAIGSLGLVAVRWRDIPSRPLTDTFFARESFFVLTILTFVLLALVVGLGMSMPIVSGIPVVGPTLQQSFGTVFEIDDGSAMSGMPASDGRFSLAPSFYNVTTPPLGLVAVILMIVGPLLGWRDVNMRHMIRALRWPAAAAVIATCIALVLGVRNLIPLAYVLLCTFAIGTNTVMIIRTLRGGWMRIGGYLTHVGVCILLIGVVGSSAYASPDERVALQVGEDATIYDHTITFNGWKRLEDGTGVIDLTVKHGNETFSAQPMLYFNEQMGSTMQTPAIKNYLWQDLYIAPADYIPEVDQNRPFVSVGQTVEIGPYTVTFQEFEIDQESMMAGESPTLGAKLQVIYEGKTSDLSPAVKARMDEATGDATMENVPATLPGGHVISLAWFNLEQRVVMLQTEGLGLPVQPERAVISVAVKPAVALVWLGLIVGVLGGTIAMLRRAFEGEARLRGEPVRLPKGIAGLFRP